MADQKPERVKFDPVPPMESVCKHCYCRERGPSTGELVPHLICCRCGRETACAFSILGRFQPR